MEDKKNIKRRESDIYKPKFSIKFRKPIFYVNEEKKTVTCKLSSNFNNPFNCSIKYSGAFYHLGLNYLTCSSTAYCDNEDNFDIEKGKKIALSKAECKTYKKFNEIIKRFIKNMQPLNEAATDFENKCNLVVLHNIEYIEKISTNKIETRPIVNCTTFIQ